MSLLPLLVLALIGSGASASPVYNYTLTLTLVNGDLAQSATEYGSPYFYLLNQNIFPNSSFQSVELSRVSLNGVPSSYALSFDADGNPLVTVVSDGSLAPHANATLEMSFRVTLWKPEINLTSSGNLSSIPDELKQAFPLTGSFNVSSMPNSQEIEATALAIKGDEEDVLAIILDIAKWFEDNMVYSSNFSVPQNVSSTYDTRSGDCDDQANLFVTFCRILGIPAYTTIGPIYLQNQLIEEEENLRFNLTNASWHGWAMAYLPGNGGQWVPVDLTFFRGAYLMNGHVKSTDLEQHIIGSAIAYWDTLEYAYVKNVDYVSTAVESKSNITSSDIVWVEEHLMLREDGGEPPYADTVDSFGIMMLFVAAFAIVVFIILFFRRRTRNVEPPPMVSVQ